MGGVDTFFVADLSVGNEIYHVTAVRVGLKPINDARMLGWLKHKGVDYVLFGSRKSAAAAAAASSKHEHDDEVANPQAQEFECYFGGFEVFCSAAEAVRLNNQLTCAIARALAILENTKAMSCLTL